MTVIRGHKGIGQPVRGIALVAADNFSARYDLDRVQGTFSRPAHKLFGQSYVGKVLVLNAARGGVATSWMLAEMAARDLANTDLDLNVHKP
jgi:predicted aconitase with swiveling domain